MIDVPAELISSFGAVSAEVAREMATGALANSRAHVALSVTGVAGPGGGTAQKPVGLVHCAAALRDREVIQDVLNLGDIGREAIRLATVAHVIEMAYEAASLTP